MYLKSVEIQGFKSFPDHVTINLSRGITAIVGPNGSGKSNIVDAVRWVLGEQSTKTLRGGKMEDVIFGGTTKRTPSGYSQVSLTIDNSEGILPLDYNEVTVTRRYYRSGDSEFYINKKSVRLKDIHELFMDTGLGRDGYSIIGQGRIDEILSVKSGDRREIFEEAAGITKFRYRKEEAEKKLDGTEENLVRIRDIVTELEGQIEPMRKQAQKAKRYLILIEEMRGLEIALWLMNVEKLDESAKKTGIDYDNAIRLLSAKKAELDECYAEEERLRMKMHEKDLEIEGLRNKSASIADEISNINKDAAILATNIENLTANIRDIEEQLGKDNDKESDIVSRIEALKEKASGLENEKAELIKSLEDIRSKAESESEKSREALGKITAINDAISENLRKKAVLDANIIAEERALSESRDRIENDKSRISQIEEQINGSDERKKMLSKAIDEQNEKKQSAQNILDGYALIAENKEKKYSELREKAEKDRRDFHTKSDRLNMLSAMEKDMEGFSRAVKIVMDAGGKGVLPNVYGTVSQLIRTDDEYGTAIEIALGGSLQNIVVETEEDGKKAIGYLKSRDGGRATFLPISAVTGREMNDVYANETGYVGPAYKLVEYDKKYDGIIKNLLGNTLVVDNIDNAIRISRKHKGKARLVTLDGQIISQSGSMTGGSLNKNTGILARANEAEKLKEQLSEMEKSMEKRKAELLEAESSVKSMRYSMETAKLQLQEAEVELSRLTARRENEDSSLVKLSEEKENIAQGVEYLTQKTAQITENIAKYKAEMAVIEKSSMENAEKLAEVTAEQASNNAFMAELTDKIMSSNERIAALDSEKQGNSDMIRHLESLIAELHSEREGRKSGIDSYKEKIAAFEKERAGLDDKIKAFEQSEKQTQAEIRSKIDEKLELEGKRERIQRDSKNKNETINNLEHESVRLESKKNQDVMQKQQILDKMWESYELTPITAQSVRAEITDVPEANRRLGQLKNEIRSLGNVNLSAVEEYEKLFERYSFLNSQREDLEKAKGDILKIITDLTKNMQETFAKHFEMLNKSFGETFVEIFGGGNAYLQLEDEKDILNCGIDIKVTLPGKTVKTISLLSGGEKAFVAIALYFAILKVRPTPFCILDEIEAALDDVNVDKYISYMRTLCKNTQFIVITHRRGTMEGADILYGVAMQETGVSKLLTINVSEIEEKIRLNV